MERLWTIMKKELIHIWRDPRTLALILALPAMLLVLLGYGIAVESRDTPMAVADLSQTDSSRRYVDYYTASSDFAVDHLVFSEAEILALMDEDRVTVGLLIPEDFGRKVATGEPAQVQLFVNGSIDPTESQTVQLKLSSISQMASQDILVRQIERMPATQRLQLPIDGLVKTLYNPDGDSRLFMIPGLIPILLMVQVLILSALAIVREREQGTMEQLIVTPIKTWELMLGKIIPYMLVSIVNLFALLWLGDLLFGVKVAGNLWELVGASVIFIIGSLGMGVLISNLAQSQMQAIYVAVFIVMVPAIILSGFLYPRDNMPAVTFWYSELMPVTQYLEITRGMIVRGSQGTSLWESSILPLILLSVGYFTASVLVFRKRI